MAVMPENFQDSRCFRCADDELKQLRHYDPTLEVSKEHLGYQVTEKMAFLWKRRGLSPNGGKHIVQERTLLAMKERERESRVHPYIQLHTFVPLLQYEIFVPHIARCKGCAGIHFGKPGRKARHKFHVRQNLHTSKTTDSSQDLGKPARRFVQQIPVYINSSRSRVATAFCSLSCEESSSLPFRSKQHTILNASVVLRAMEGARNSSSQLLQSARIGAKSNARVAWNFSSPLLSVFEHAAVR